MRPLSLEGRAIVANAAAFQNQVSVGASGPVGLNMPACLAILEHLGIPAAISVLLLPGWERGVLEAISENRDQNRT
ncbi:MAG: hypothetical protein AAGL89_16055 [Pseudomonadota bacterium]